MNIQISFKNIDSSAAMRVFTEEKTQRLKKYFDGKVHVVWTLTIEGERQIAHCHLLGNHMDYFGESVSEDLHASVDLTIDKIEKQIRKHKEIITDHKH